MSPCREVCFDGLSEHCVPRKSTIVATEYVKADNKVSRIFRVKLEETDHVHHTSDWNGSLQRLNTFSEFGCNVNPSKWMLDPRATRS